MKQVYRFILPILLLLSVEAKSQAYTYHPFPVANAIWLGHIKYCSLGPCTTLPEPYSMDADTIVNNILYHKVLRSNNFPLALVREDSSRRVFYIDVHDTVPERILYDFTLGSGDTMFSGQHFFVVTAVDTLNYLGVLRRTLSVKINSYLNGANNTDTWIEGIGSTSTPIGLFLPCGCNSRTICSFYQDSTLLYGRQGDPYCSAFYLSINETSADYSVDILPNPSATFFTIQLSSPPTTQTYFNLYDALGRAVKREEIVSETTTMHRSNLPSGIYFWQLQQGNKILDRGKVVME
jgi:hypothetical protein